MAFDGIPEIPFTEALSLVVNCENQDEVDYYWGKLTDGGEEVQCGWLKDRFGVSWQVMPLVLTDFCKIARRLQRLYTLCCR